jgi:hypothetical protein
MSNIVKVTPTEAMTLGKVFAESGLFPDIKAAGQAVVKIMAGQEMGIGPFQAMNGIHIIQGKATVGAGLMGAMVKGSGKYDYRVLEQSAKKCTIEFYQGKESIGQSTFTDLDAKAAGTKNMDKYAQNMLFARAMSNGCKWFTPDVFNGPVYTPEELGGVEVVDTVAEVMPDPNAHFVAVNAALNELQAVTDIAGLAPWKAKHIAVVKVPDVLTAATLKHSSLLNEAK